MEHHDSLLTTLLNKYFGAQFAALLRSLGIEVHDPKHAFPDYVVMSAVVVLIGTVFVLWLRPRLSVERPGATQQVVEMLLTNPLGFGIRDLLDNNVGHEGRKFVAMTGTVSIFILMCNLLGVIPIFASPTGSPASPSVPLACAIVTFLYFNYQGMKHAGVLGYLKHFAGPNPFLAPLLFPVEIISTTARILSLTVRLWANIFASDLLYFVFLGLFMLPSLKVGEKIPVLGWILGIFPATLPVAFIGLHIFVAVMQTFVFTILPSIYLGLAVSEEH